MIELHMSSGLPLRFSSIFWTNAEVQLGDRYAYFQSDVIINENGNGPQGISVKIAARRDQTELQPRHAYRIDGPVAVWGPHNKPILMEDFQNTIEINHAEVRPNCLANKVLAQGLGRIVEWSRRETSGLPIEVIKVLHRCWNSTRTQRVDFHANYLLNTNITSKFTMDALNVGNLISLRGRVVSFIDIHHIWEIEATEIPLILTFPRIIEDDM
ncbi:uncharacterized protein MELLADRAFT_62579 [Melampsora larici-populina 98AG31]|uniref:Uncharacterized protein n=1 Tax=Melampsora larici-populina (strain 98AG31 / pathotype 3-4-7) TaxID=747676 RepID=F4RJF7_MELLP|nr:uncharacterized protein MELLADRAFT_62579 [Melampsora larici-populina 98AG31]EGG07503.1 hypothetical protein MELLADRAFT_62579 [Melampsora larici-populina 98AG31]